MEKGTEHERLECPKCGATWEDDVVFLQRLRCANPACRAKLVIVDADDYLIAVPDRWKGAA